MTTGFNEIMKAAVDSMEDRMDALHDKYVPLFEENRDEDEKDLDVLMKGVLASMENICNLVEQTGEKILARRSSPSPTEEVKE